MRAQSIEALDKAAANVPRNLKIVLDRRVVQAGKARLADVRAMMKPSAARGGEIRIVMPLEDRGQEMEWTLPGKYDVSRQDLEKMSTVPGVAEVVDI